MKVLLVDDNTEIRRILRRLLSDLPFDILECEGGHEALVLSVEQHPEWILMDLEMAPVDGLTLTSQIRQLTPESRIVMITNHDHPRLRQAAAAAGAVGYVLKENLLELKQLLQVDQSEEHTRERNN